jgi:hypothetical protein
VRKLALLACLVLGLIPSTWENHDQFVTGVKLTSLTTTLRS